MGGLIMSLLKIGAKKRNGTASPLTLTNEGELEIKRNLNCDKIELYNSIPTSVVVSANVPVGEYATVSLRVVNTTDSDIEFQLLDDEWASGSDWTYDFNGEIPKFVIPKKSRRIVTIEDFPIMNYVYNMHFRISGKTTPTTGTVKLTAYAKR